jgi:hypothetical protein
VLFSVNLIYCQIFLSRALDLSKNCFTLDTKTQCKVFTTGLSNLEKLQSLSVAHNKIQDEGFSLVAGIILNNLHSLTLLDASNCFISSKSSNVLHSLLSLSLDSVFPRIEEILFQENLFLPHQLQDLNYEYGNHPMKCKLSVYPPHLGIEFPLRYDSNDFGLDLFSK